MDKETFGANLFVCRAPWEFSFIFISFPAACELPMFCKETRNKKSKLGLVERSFFCSSVHFLSVLFVINENFAQWALQNILPNFYCQGFWILHQFSSVQFINEINVEEFLFLFYNRCYSWKKRNSQSNIEILFSFLCVTLSVSLFLGAIRRKIAMRRRSVAGGGRKESVQE